MSAKRQLLKYNMLAAVDASIDQTSKPTSIEYQDDIGIQVDINSGSPTGVVNIEISANYAQDNNGNVLNAGTWTVLTTQAITAGSPSPTYFDLATLSAPWIRVRYAATSGSGTLTALITGKTI